MTPEEQLLNGINLKLGHIEFILHAFYELHVGKFPSEGEFKKPNTAPETPHDRS